MGGESKEPYVEFCHEKECHFPTPDKMGVKFYCVIGNEMHRAGISREEMYQKVFFRSADGKIQNDAASITSFMIFFSEAATSDKYGFLPDGKHGFYLCTNENGFIGFVDKLVEVIENFDQNVYELLPTA